MKQPISSNSIIEYLESRNEEKDQTGKKPLSSIENVLGNSRNRDLKDFLNAFNNAQTSQNSTATNNNRSKVKH